MKNTSALGTFAFLEQELGDWMSNIVDGDKTHKQKLQYSPARSIPLT
jgi:hypothetical protein